jgi:hypothetical protein
LLIWLALKIFQREIRIIERKEVKWIEKIKNEKD